MSDDLVERVAREFCTVDGTDPCEVVCGLCLHRAGMVVAVCMKEAAKVCDEAEKRERQAAKEPCDAEELAAFQRGAFMSRINAAAIRALIKEPTPGSQF